ncbi:MAG: acyl carrier protein [Planctomycetes bacterium]|nr:acyl carrier protein [Planctomycetota bacterium]
MIRRADMKAKICDFVYEQFPLARQRGLGAEDSLLESGVVDSLGVLDLMAFLESEFNVSISDEEMVSENFKSVSRLADLVLQKLGGENAAWTS